jgi:hypothetical protein
MCLKGNLQSTTKSFQSGHSLKIPKASSQGFTTSPLQNGACNLSSESCCPLFNWSVLYSLSSQSFSCSQTSSFQLLQA